MITRIKTAKSAPTAQQLAAVATMLLATPAVASDDTPFDPWHGANRVLFALSMQLDRMLLAPVSHGYRAIIPEVLRNRVSRAVDNLGEPGTMLNDLAQGHPRRAGRATARFAINSTLGVAGLFDVAGAMNIPLHDSDFGQTLGRYGVGPGPYVYVPIIGPSDLRDGLGRIVDVVTDPVSLLTGGITTTLGASRFSAVTIDTRTRADAAFRALDDATDPYATARSAYTQRRSAVVLEATGGVEVLPDFDAPPEPAADAADAH